MEKKSSNWYVPPDIAVHFALPVVVAMVCVLAGVLLPLENDLKTGDALGIYFTALGLEAAGIILLFLARLPLYRQRRFWTVGPRELDRTHRRLYWLAYSFVIAGFGLLALVWLMAR
jgi:hypothetical protein